MQARTTAGRLKIGSRPGAAGDGMSMAAQWRACAPPQPSTPKKRKSADPLAPGTVGEPRAPLRLTNGFTHDRLPFRHMPCTIPRREQLSRRQAGQTACSASEWDGQRDEKPRAAANMKH